MAKKRKHPTDTEVGIRTISQIEKLPVGELTDEEICKLFFRRFGAKALIMMYIDDTGEQQAFGRLYRTKSGEALYDRLSSYFGSVQVLTDLVLIHNPDDRA
ncbi:hypothetical protein [Siphonobacter curvatus]|uniref:Uncharacterized protein n=1 Tax=Siphonobacter curvatus TaxID=2094562 RepID=A0A2S7IR34_9BACT|nr:hypothetical protein [Siphonobacter curvatus]PQA60181.1 hypothetical protein C5O19_11340 [Siphonobacter curvatus]